ncbi:LexA family transcriptional regulator [Salinicola tamaricis]|uniref:LexA family transcriptional regulator n=1 Tax=Salinicola tamaricis TaxID=1771309 RepID=UPI000D0A021A|nr:S24 family peptidase [Salinicola tamaricis]
MIDKKAIAEGVLERMKSVLELSSDKEIAAYFGISPTSVHNWRRRGSVPYDECVRLAIAKKISLGWLVLGDGDVADTSLAVNEPAGLYLSDSPPETKSVPLYDVEGAAGAGRSLEHETVVGHFPMTAELIAQLGLTDARLAGIRVRGDSMEPTLFDGDWTFINLNDTNWSLGGVFLVWVSGELRIKRVQRLSGGAMYLISDNTHYEKEMIPRSQMQEVAIIGRVKTRLGGIA